MSYVWFQVHNGKLHIVHTTGYIAFTWDEWQEAKVAGDGLFGKPDAVPGYVVHERTRD